MKSDFHGLRTTIYKVADINQAKAWYNKVLGIQPYFDEPFYVGFNVGGYELGLQPEEGKDGAAKGGVATYWGVDDVKKTFERLIAQGATAFENPADVGGNIIVAAVKDPWGIFSGLSTIRISKSRLPEQCRLKF